MSGIVVGNGGRLPSLCLHPPNSERMSAERGGVENFVVGKPHWIEAKQFILRDGVLIAAIRVGDPKIDDMPGIARENQPRAIR